MADPQRLFVACLVFLALFAGEMWSMRFENRLLTPEAAVFLLFRVLLLLLEGGRWLDSFIENRYSFYFAFPL